MIKIEIQHPQETLLNIIAKTCQLDEYEQTISNLHIIDVSKDLDYQKNYTHYYKVRRDEDWLKEYYSFLEKNKDNTLITFSEILKYISSIPHATKYGQSCTVEPSFASKMLTTINPNYPVWDEHVLKATGVVLKAKTFDEKINEDIRIYSELKNKVDAFLGTENSKECIAAFDKMFPQYQWVSPVKKLDLYLWKMGG